jgi:hypothetical protein
MKSNSRREIWRGSIHGTSFHGYFSRDELNTMWHKDLLLRGDSVAKVQLLLDYNNGNGVFYVVHAEML